MERESRIRVFVVNESHGAHKDVERKRNRCVKGWLVDWLDYRLFDWSR